MKVGYRRHSAYHVPRHAQTAARLAGVLCWIALATSALGQSAGTNDGLAAHRVDVATREYGVNGSGVKVCVMSDSINDAVDSLIKAKNNPNPAVAGGPNPAVPKSIDVLANGSGTGEGLGMLEIVHKIAPGATLGFAPTGSDEATMVQNIRALAGPSHNCISS
jgi:hypothetical protein